MKNISSKRKIELIRSAALAKKAKDVALLDLRKLPAICDYFVLASGDSTTQIETIADNIEKTLAINGSKAWHREGNGETRWILLDYGDIVVHVFHKETRDYYDLDRLWHGSPRRTFEILPAEKKAKRRIRRKSKK
ncbi:MAG: ribosome silencing factor [Candidatus Omnitrophica bacterium]|nr:ribosome silencing factor [Candidatus Omnitrophota bacterium]